MPKEPDFLLLSRLKRRSINNSSLKKRFCLVPAKPSHYDDDGYIIQWLRSAIPSNSLACLYGLALECAENKVLSENVEIEIYACDETNTGIQPKKIISLIEKSDDGMVMLVGVQSNQFPRALDIAAPLREKNIKVAVVGFHVSGTIAMLKTRDAHVQGANHATCPKIQGCGALLFLYKKVLKNDLL